MLLVIKCLGYGGAERLLVDMVAARDRVAFDYEVAYVLAAENTLVPAIRAEGVPVHSLGAGHNWDLRWMAGFRRLLEDGRFDVVHFHLPYAAAMGRLVIASLPRARRPAVIYTEHSLWDRTAAPVRLVNRLTIGRDQALVAVSAAAHEALPEPLKARAEVIVHGVDLSRSAEMLEQREQIRAEVRSELGVAADELLVLTVANLRTEKGYDVLLDAARIVADHGDPIRFRAVGRGPLEAELEARRRDLDLGDRFRFLGPRDDVVRLMVGSDVFVLPSRHEGLPVSLMEATSVGLAVVATAVGGVPGVLTNGEDALLVPPGSPAALAEAVERMGTDPELRSRLGTSARGRSTVFDVAEASRRIEQIYRQAVAGPDSGGTEPLVLHVVPTAAGRGAQREARALSDQLDAPGVRRHRLLCLFDGPEEVVPDFSLHAPGGERPASGFDPRLVRRLRAFLADHQPAVVIAHGGDPLKFLVPAMAGTRRPLVYYAIGTYAGPAGRRLQVRLWRHLAGRADIVAACGEEVRQECTRLLGVPPSQVVLVANGRDPARYHPDPEASEHLQPLVLFVGALIPTKRPDRFIELIARLRALERPLRAQLIGDGPMRHDLIAPAAAADVEMLGARADVPALLSQADLLVFPSVATGEGMPGVLIEAGLSGLPVVTTAVPGVGAIIEDGESGLVVGIDDLDAMTDAAARLLDDPGLRAEMGRAARRHCLAHFSMATVAARWSDIVDPLIVER